MARGTWGVEAHDLCLEGEVRGMDVSQARRTDLGLQSSYFADRKTDSQSVGFRLNGTHLGLAKLHVAHSKDEKRP